MSFFEDENTDQNSQALESDPLNNIEDYQFANANNVKSLVDDMNSGTQSISSEQEIEEIEESFELPDFQEPEIEKEVSPTQKKMAKDTSHFIVSTIDGLFTKILASYAKTDVKELQTDEAEIKEISSYFEPYFSADNYNVPPWVMGTVTASFVMFDKFSVSTKLRKANIELELEKKRTKDLEAKIRKLKLEKQEQELEKEVSNLKNDLKPKTED